ncbi:hypothetical protein PFISCL1PPCAC_4766 [Pristionchus fissidentatus]|uniref:Phosphatase n=1 Tax=Pristionchus fissidentatus TaxID=1538716 RepID=A0AAV5V4J1_9BILA|nr:hypothetical protein PFISCL1PPCAC_4766 [Pristionchus fissidentatus]
MKTLLRMLQLLYLLHLIVLAAADKLLHAQIIIRHADRAPMQSFTSAQSAALFPRGLTEITNAGLRHAYEEGLLFGQRYHELGLLSECTSSNDVIICIYIQISIIYLNLHKLIYKFINF